MKFHAQFLDIQAYEAQRSEPAGIFDRVGGEKWLVREEPLKLKPDGDLIAAPENWALVSQGSHVRVPLHSYLSAGDDPPVVVAYAFQLGCLAMQELGNAPLLAFQLFMGHPLVEVPGEKGNSFRVWLGFAMRVSDG